MDKEVKTQTTKLVKSYGELVMLLKNEKDAADRKDTG